MTAIATLMTFEERVRAVQAFGCSRRQAHFLALVALHSGYYVRRQYLNATGTQNGKNAQRFLERLLTCQVVARCTYRADRGHVYRLQHVCEQLPVQCDSDGRDSRARRSFLRRRGDGTRETRTLGRVRALCDVPHGRRRLAS